MPERHKPGRDAFAIRPRHAEEWVAMLPMGDTGETARRVYHALHEVNRLQYSPKARFRFLELLRKPLEQVQEALGRRYLYSTFPLPDKQANIARLAQVLYQEMALGYRIVACETLQRNILFRDRSLLRTALHRAIHYLGQVLLGSYQVYTNHSQDTWRNLHALYRCAEETRLHSDKVTDSLNPQSRRATIATLYKQILLLSLASPYRLRQGEARHIFNQLSTWATHVALVKPDAPDAEDALFSIRLDSDHEPDYRAFDQQECNGHDCRLLQTRPLARLLREELLPLAEQKEKDREALSPELLHRLYLAWSVAPKRDFSRTDRHGEIGVVVGLSAIHKAVTAHLDLDQGEVRRAHFESRTVHPVSDEVGKDIWDLYHYDTDDDLERSLDNEARESEGPPPAEYTAHRWQIINESAGGYRLAVTEQQSSLVQVGQLLGLAQGEEDISWIIGVIRWFRQTQEGNLDLGVQVLSPYALPITLESDKRPGKAQRALLLSKVHSPDQKSSLITPPMLFEAGDEVTISTPGQKGRTELGRKIQDNGLFVQFRIKGHDFDPAAVATDEGKGDALRDSFEVLWQEL